MGMDFAQHNTAPIPNIISNKIKYLKIIIRSRIFDKIYIAYQTFSDLGNIVGEIVTEVSDEKMKLPLTSTGLEFRGIQNFLPWYIVKPIFPFFLLPVVLQGVFHKALS